MIKLNDKAFFHRHSVSPLLNDVAVYSSLGFFEIKMLSLNLRTNSTGTVHPLPPAIADRTHWKYGPDIHSSDSIHILGCIMISAKLNHDIMTKIRHIVIEWWSQGLIGMHVTTRCDIIHFSSNYLKSTDRTKIPLKNVHTQSNVPLYIFFNWISVNCLSYQAKLLCATRNILDPTNQLPWSQVKKIIDKVHKHACGHANLSYIRILLQRNNMWSAEVEKYLNHGISSCTDCAKTYEPKKAC